MGQKERKWLDGERAAGYLNNHRHSGAKFPSLSGTGRYSGAGAKKLCFSLQSAQNMAYFYCFLELHVVSSEALRFYRAADKMSKVNFFHPKTISRESKQNSSVLLGFIMLISHILRHKKNFTKAAKLKKRLKWIEKEDFSSLKGVNNSL